MALAAAILMLPATARADGTANSVHRESLYVAVRDGTKLAMNIYRPAIDGKAVEGRLPTVFVFTPYRARFRAPDGKITETVLSDPRGVGSLLQHGYAVAVADIRGKGASFGRRRGFQDRTEAMDGHDLVGWLAAQPWSSGKVGMYGCSYVGGTTLQVATTSPPALKAIFTGATDLDKYAFVRRGGITAQFNTRPDEPLSVDLASLPVDADADGALLREAVAGHAANTPMADLWYGMPYRNSVSPLTGNRYWEEVGPYTYLKALKASGIATYFWGNWQDEPTEQVIQQVANIGGKLLAGPGSHCIIPPGFDFSGELRRYFDQHLKGIDTGINREPRHSYWLENAPKGQEWVRTDQLPGAGSKRTRWYLAGGRSGTAASVNDGTLTAARPDNGRDMFTVNYDVGSAEYFAFWVAPQTAKGLSYTGEALAAPVKLVGAPIVHLTVAADRKDANVFAYLEDVAPDGTAAVISFGRQAASHRKLAKAPYDTLGMPWHSGRAADFRPLVPGKAASLSFGLTPMARIVQAGHRLRVTVTGADPRQRNLAQIRETPPPQLTLVRGGPDASRIELPIAD